MTKHINTLVIFTLILLVFSCGPKRERFNYTLIKSKMANLTEEQVADFDDITSAHLSKARAVFEGGSGDPDSKRKQVAEIFSEQDTKIQGILTEEQFVVYASEIKIEREGREKHNTTLIRNELGLDSLQVVQYDLANEAFYKLLIDNHDNYHGKPDVYMQYYAEIDVSRKEAFNKLMTKVQYAKYLELVDQYKIGKSEAY